MSAQVEQTVAKHYGNSSIEQRILEGLRSVGKDVDRLTTDDLAPVDEFHIGGREATVDIAEAMNIRPGMHLLDVGCGIGGPARFFAQHYRARVTGIDLTREFIDAAEALTKRLRLESQVQFHCGSALQLPFDDGSFDGAYLFHVGMNISDKGRLFSEVRRVVKQGGVFAVYDVMRTGAGDLAFPVPWAMEQTTSFLAMPERYRLLLQGTGFHIARERNRREFALEFFAAMRARAADGTASPVGLPLLMGERAPLMLANMTANLKSGLIAPVEMICR